MSLLEDYIGRQDALALASLLEYCVNYLGLTASILVQLARDLGEDFYAKYWPRTVTLLSQSVNHSDFTVIEVCGLEMKLIIGCFQCFLLAIEIPCSSAGRKSS
jgi:hypothetical protein